MFRIGEFSKLSKTTIKALRYYDEIGLLKPEATDKFTGYRFYTTNQLFKLHTIQSLRQVGLSIEEIQLVLSGHNKRSILEKRKSELITALCETNEQISRLDFILQGKEDDYLMSYVATIKDLPECIVYCKKMNVPDYNSYFTLIPEIGEKVLKKYPGLKCSQPEYCFISYLDNEYRETNFNVEFCEAVDKVMPDFDDIYFKKIESVKAVSVMHKGGYEDLSKAYAYVFNWIEQNEYVIAESPRENYIDGVWNKEDKSEWLTELQIPIIKK